MATLQHELGEALEKYGCHCGECLTIVKASQVEFVDAMMNILRRHKYDLIQLATVPKSRDNPNSDVLPFTDELEEDSCPVSRKT